EGDAGRVSVPAFLDVGDELDVLRDRGDEDVAAEVGDCAAEVLEGGDVFAPSLVEREAEVPERVVRRVERLENLGVAPLEAVRPPGRLVPEDAAGAVDELAEVHDRVPGRTRTWP